MYPFHKGEETAQRTQRCSFCWLQPAMWSCTRNVKTHINIAKYASYTDRTILFYSKPNEITTLDSKIQKDGSLVLPVSPSHQPFLNSAKFIAGSTEPMWLNSQRNLETAVGRGKMVKWPSSLSSVSKAALIKKTEGVISFLFLSHWRLPTMRAP